MPGNTALNTYTHIHTPHKETSDVQTFRAEESAAGQDPESYTISSLHPWPPVPRTSYNLPVGCKPRAPLKEMNTPQQGYGVPIGWRCWGDTTHTE